ncbi:chromosome segregation protein SMC [Stomatohabitans albus]|uniref:chromosome segregation protein SMC n=1 Tax=Stomatohabitans albus TaxID=3110766 RepID=UPI00300CE006
MHLTSVRLRGFKSFADDTTLTFTPGITAIVGPNGSGKSNIVDALTWVMGTRSPRQLRGAQMSDVIFAGSGSRRGMGRASVDITIDNADGLLPIEFAEVTVGRSLFANGEGGSAINGADCRQIDVADLLSDTGLGRESHTIVGQGKIDAILTTDASGRRVFIEEAAGILKHRRRKDRAQRKILQLDEHLTRLDDTEIELKRLAKPLKRQAGVAQQKRRLDAQATDIKVELALRAWQQANTAWMQATALVRDHDQVMTAAKQRLRDAQTAQNEAEGRLEQANAHYGEISAIANELRTLTERAKGVAGRIDERRSGLAQGRDGDVIGRDPDALRHEASRADATIAQLREDELSARAALAEVEAERDRLAQIVRTMQHEQAERQRARTQAREAGIRWEAQIGNIRTRIEQTEQRINEAKQRYRDAQTAREELDDLTVTNRGPSEGTLRAVAADLAAAKAAKAKADEQVRIVRLEERERSQAAARAVAVAEAKEALVNQVPDGAEELVEQGIGGLVGPLLQAISIDEAYATALSAALGTRAHALLVEDPQRAQAWLDTHNRDAWLVSRRQSPVDRPLPPVPGAEWLAGLVDCEPAIYAAIARLIAPVWLVDDVFASAAQDPDAVFVDRSGLMAGAWGIGRIHGGGAQSILAAKEAAEQARIQARDLATEVDELAVRLAESLTVQEQTNEVLQELTTTATRLQTEAKAARTAIEQHEQAVVRADRAMSQAAQQVQLAQQQYEALAHELENVSANEPEAVPMDSPDDLDAFAQARVTHEQHQEQVVEARLAVQHIEGDIRRLTNEAKALRQEADRIEADVIAMRKRRAARLAALEQIDKLVEQARAIWVQTEASAQRARTEGEQAKTTRDDLAAQARSARNAVGQAHSHVDDITAQVHEAALDAQRAQSDVDLARRHLDDLGIDEPAELIAQRGAATPVDRSERVDADAIDISVTVPTQGVPDEDTDILTQRLADIEVKIGRLGPVNPLAAREYAELEQRRTFLAEQISDLKDARKDLVRLVEAVERHIGQVFEAAFDDVAANFASFFELLFPGGKGRLRLTDATDPLTTGIEIEASPPGKKVRHLSLLSGGERTLTAIAMLFAIFAARPSPFYVLDEVEAALDDANLERFVRLLSQFRHQGQWIVVTHQRRTMEAADILHGVSMNSDGVSVVLTQQLRDISDLAGDDH